VKIGFVSHFDLASPPHLEIEMKRTRDGAVTLSVFETFAELLTVSKEWDAFVEHSGSDIYFTFDWLEAWWKYYGAGRRLCCFLLHAYGQTIAALPFCIQDWNIGQISITLGKFVGSDSTNPVFTPAVEPSHESEIWSIVLHWLFVKEHLDALSLSPLSGVSSVAEAVRNVCQSNRYFEIARDESAGPHTLFFLPASLSEYMSTLSKNTRYLNRRYMRDLKKSGNITSRTLRGNEAVGRFDAFAELHRLQWKAGGRLGHFGDWPSSLAFNKEIVTQLAKKDRVRFHEILRNDELIASRYSLVLGDRCYARLSARRLDGEVEGLGRLALVDTVEALIREGVQLIEDGPSHYDYKVRHGGKELPVRRLLLARMALSSRIKTRMLLLWSDLINLFYYRIWFLRFRPYFRKTAPLSRVWILTRL
jgi:CelD/BcsL family acetyltransferase involved in cellulose biosynthesis